MWIFALLIDATIRPSPDNFEGQVARAVAKGAACEDVSVAAKSPRSPCAYRRLEPFLVLRDATRQLVHGGRHPNAYRFFAVVLVPLVEHRQAILQVHEVLK